MKRLAAATRSLFRPAKSTRSLQTAVKPIVTEALESRQMLAINMLHPGLFRVAPTAKGSAIISKPSKDGGKVGSTNDDGPQPYQLNGNGRWTSTATNGGGLQQGQATTIRWSVVSDGVSIPGGVGEPTAASNLRARLNAIYGSQATWQPLIQTALDSWAANTGLTYVFEPNDDGAAFNSSAGVVGVRGDIRISGHFIDGNSNVLAYNNFPAFGGDMVIDTADNTFNSTFSGSLILRNVITHEQGHGIGLNHVEPVNNTKLMEPFLSTSFTGAQFDDILGANRLYGDRFEKVGTGNDTSAGATGLGALGLGNTTTSTVSIDGTTDTDFFSFSLATSRSVSLTLTPTGGLYASYPQNSGGTVPNFNASAQSDLTLTLLASNGTTVIASSNIGGAGTTETISNVTVPAGSYFIRVTGANNVVQMYNLSTTIAAPGITGSISAVSPDPRTTPVTSIQIQFSEAVNGFDLGDITLQRDGFTESLAGASLTSGDNINWTLGNLSGITDKVGVWTVTVVAAGSGIVAQSNGNGLSANLTDSWNMQGLNGTGSNDVLRIAKNAGNSALTDVFFNSGSVSYSFNTVGINQLVVSGNAGDDVFTVDYTNGSPLPNGGSTYDGGSNTNGDTYRQIGQAASDTFNMSSSVVTRTSPAGVNTSFSNTEILDLSVGTYTTTTDLNGVAVVVGTDGVAQFNATQHLAGLTVNNGGRANVGLNGNRILVTNSLSIGASGLVDLFDNDLLLEYSGASPVTQVQQWIVDARTAGSWNGFGLTSTSARNAFPRITTLGVLEGSQYDAMRGAGTLFGGENPDATSVLVKYTYYGDTDFNGRVNFDDYARIDTGFLNGLTGWMNGDSNSDGVINFDDYALVDQAFLSQGGVVL